VDKTLRHSRQIQKFSKRVTFLLFDVDCRVEIFLKFLKIFKLKSTLLFKCFPMGWRLI
jgi:hypothetical protein